MRKGKVAPTVIASILWFVGFFVSPSDGKLIVGLSSVNVAFLPVYVTEDRGFFKAEGLDVLLVLFNAGATNLQALVGGDIQIMGSAFVETIGAEPGSTLKIFGASVTSCRFSSTPSPISSP